MTIERLAPNQIGTDLSLHLARESCWRALINAGFIDVVIDVDKNVVAGSKGAGWRSNGEILEAKFEDHPLGCMVEVKVKSSLPSTLDFGRFKRRTRNITDQVETFFKAPQVELEKSPLAPRVVAPIAAPDGSSSFVMSAPVYGPAMPAKRGSVILIYAVLGLFLVHIFSPFAWYYAHSALKEYGDIDPGDKKQVKLGRTLGIIGTVILIGLWTIPYMLATFS
jgi:hypothetical protein